MGETPREGGKRKSYAIDETAPWGGDSPQAGRRPAQESPTCNYLMPSLLLGSKSASAAAAPAAVSDTLDCLGACNALGIVYKSRSPPVPLSPPRAPGLLHNLSMQNAHASKKIQKVWRGFATRRGLWRWGGRLLVSRVVKIQKVLRGWRGRRRALAQLQRKRANFANKIKGSYFIWQARMKVRILKAEFAQGAVLKVQCMYRSRLARAKVRAARLAYHNYICIKLCRVARGYLGRRRFKALRARSRVVFQEMTALIMRDIRLVVHGTKITMETLSDNDGAATAAWTEWDFVKCALYNLLGANRRDLALEIATELVRRFPAFTIGRFLLQVTLFCTWTCSGKAEFVRHDYLDELVGMLYFNKAEGDERASFDVHVKAMPLEIVADATSMFDASVEEIEFMYFRNAFVRHGRSSVALSSMAACVLMRMKPSTFGENPDYDKAHRLALERARRLLGRAMLVNTTNVGESTSRLEVMDNVFFLPHRVVMQEDKSFIRCRMLGFDAFSQLNPAVKNSLKDTVVASVEVIRCGEMFIIHVKETKMPMTAHDLHVMRERNHVDELVEMAPKWIMELLPDEQQQQEQQQERRTVVAEYHVRPLVLHSAEVLQLTQFAIAADALKNSISQDAVREKGLTHVLAEYLLREMRLVSCRSRLVMSASQHELSSFRVVIPALEYKRQESNNLRTTDFSLKMIQRVFRGFRGKARFRRLRARANEVKRQRELLLRRQEGLQQLRVWRHGMASKIQAKLRRFLWRRLMKKLHRAALQVQCAVRIRQAWLAVAKLRNRKLVGPEVVEMLRRGVSIGGLDFTLIIYRCGDNYRMAGHDMVRNAIYEGSLHRQDVIRLVQDYNSKLPPNALAAGKVKKLYLGSYHRVAELIASQLGLATAMTAVTTPLGALAPTSRAQLSLVAIATAKPSMRGIEKVANLNRILKDQSQVIDHYNKLVLAKQKILDGTQTLSASMQFTMKK